MPSERTPLLDGSTSRYEEDEVQWHSNQHAQFCMLVGIPPSHPGLERGARPKPPPSRPVPKQSLYGRATRQLRDQRATYWVTASLSNTLLLSQVILGAALTALGASASSHVLITLFGAANTIIAGLVAYLKSRGQPMRARMFLDDLERVVGEIENSEVMWLGITHGAHGYDEINTDEHQVTVRSEVARLTRLYDRAVNSNTVNNPDMYMSGSAEASTTALKKPQPGQTLPPTSVVAPPPAVAPAVPAVTNEPAVVSVPPVAADPDESPATAAPAKTSPPKDESKAETVKKEDGKEGDVKKEEGKEGDVKAVKEGDDTTEDKGKDKEEIHDTKKEQEEDINGVKKNKQGSILSTASSDPDGLTGTTQVESLSSDSAAPAGKLVKPATLVWDPDASPASDPNIPLKT